MGEEFSDRRDLIELVGRLMTGDFETEEEVGRAVADFTARVRHPRASDLIFHWSLDFDTEPTAEEVVDRALSYRPIEL